MSEPYTVAYPVLAPEDQAFVEGYRSRFDQPGQLVIPAHFTLVFGCAALPRSAYIGHVEAVASQFGSIAFCCRRAILGSDDSEHAVYAFLVPEEGCEAISNLHSRLYTGPLER